MQAVDQWPPVVQTGSDDRRGVNRAHGANITRSPDLRQPRVFGSSGHLHAGCSLEIRPDREGCGVRKVTYSMGLSLDGYVNGPDGTFDWPGFGEEVFAFSIEEIRRVDVHLMGRNLYETMLYWQDPAEQPGFGEAEWTWAHLWNPLPKVVFSRTLSSVEGAATLATRALADEIEALRAEPGDGDIAIGGASLAKQAAELGLIDEYWMRVYPVLVGGGNTYFAHDEQRLDLELLDARTFASGVQFLRYGVVR
nr:dihydrofolate reductase family protein [Aeromicrobium duanguangcaii]